MSNHNVVLKKCDFCGEKHVTEVRGYFRGFPSDYEEVAPEGWIRVSIRGLRIPGKDYDLCDKCRNKIMAFLEEMKVTEIEEA